MSYSESEYYAYAVHVVGTYANTFSEAVTMIEKVRESLIEASAPNLLLPNGYVDISRMREPTVQELLSKGAEIVAYGDISEWGTEIPRFGFVAGKPYVFFFKAAHDYLMQMSIPVPQQLLPPELYVSSMTGLDAVVRDFGAETLDAVTFCSTFVTKWGETGPSNSIVLYPTGFVGDGNTEGMWSATLEVNGDRIPAFATAVRYYRWFETTFRRILEVNI